jgi:hypothetical protein
MFSYVIYIILDINVPRGYFVGGKLVIATKTIDHSTDRIVAMLDKHHINMKNHNFND